MFLHEWAKKYVFQIEQGDTGYRHYQCRLHLIKKRRLSDIVKATTKYWPGHSRHWSITSSDVHSGTDFDYVMKADTRVDGPWTESDYTPPAPMTRQLRAFMECEFYPWQKQVFDMVQELDDRSIKVIYDPVGSAGKSIFCEYLAYKKLVFEMPPLRAMEDIMQCAMCLPAQKAFIIDMPRAMKKDKLADFYSGLESLKNGTCYDKRYTFKMRRFDRPQVIVFTNTLPQWTYMSRDRWEVYNLANLELVKSDIDNPDTLGLLE